MVDCTNVEIESNVLVYCARLCVVTGVFINKYHVAFRHLAVGSSTCADYVMMLKKNMKWTGSRLRRSSASYAMRYKR